MTEDLICRTLVQLYLTEARECGMAAPDAVARGDDPEAADESGAARRTRQLPADPADEAAYILELVHAACATSGCSCEDLVAGGYALRQWAQRRSLAEQRRWPRAARCPHVTLIDGLAGAEFAGGRGPRDWYILAAALRRVALRGAGRSPVLNDYLLEWIEENTHYLT